MDRDALVEKVIEHRVMYTGRCSCGEQLRNAAPETVAGHVLDAILPDVIEAVQEEAAQVAELKAVQLNNAGISLPEREWARAVCESQGATESAAAIRAAVLGDALKGGK